MQGNSSLGISGIRKSNKIFLCSGTRYRILKYGMWFLSSVLDIKNANVRVCKNGLERNKRKRIDLN
ncbi:MAG: hypothetical protein V1660_03910 [archaeon]